MNKWLLAVLVLGLSNTSLEAMRFFDNLSDGSSSDDELEASIAPDPLNTAFIQDDDAFSDDLSRIDLSLDDRRERLLLASVDNPGLSGNGSQVLIDSGVFEQVAHENLLVLCHEDTLDQFSGVFFQSGDRLFCLPCFHVFLEETLVYTLAISLVCPSCFRPVEVDLSVHRQTDDGSAE